MGDKDSKDSKDSKDQASDGMTRDELGGIFRQIGAHIKQQNDTIIGLGQQVKALTEVSAGGGGGRDHDTVDDKTSVSVKLEEMSREQFGDHLIDRMSKEVVDPIRKTVQQDTDSRIHSNLTNQVRSASENHPDFNHWHEEIKAITKAHPTMNVEEAYQLVRVQDPDKSKGIDTELKKADEKAAKEREKSPAAAVTPIFGGLLPTSGMTSDKEDGAMTAKEAGEAAWDATHMSEHLAAVSDN